MSASRREWLRRLAALWPAIVAAQAPPGPTAEQKKALADAQKDPVLAAMMLEMGRMSELRTLPEVPYYVELACDDVHLLSVSATLGAAFAPSVNRARPLRVQVRVGSPQFDNTNSIYSDYYSGARYDSGQLPVEGNVAHMRMALWLALDRAYKTAVEGLGRKSAAMRGVSSPDPLADFGPAPVTELVRPALQPKLDETRWTAMVKKLSAVYRDYPKVTISLVEFDLSLGTSYLVHSGGTVVRHPDGIAILRTRAGCQAADGMALYDGGQWVASDPAKLAAEGGMLAEIRAVAERLTALAAAPAGENDIGPVLFEPRAAAQIFGEIFGTHVCAARRPVAEPGRNVPFVAGEFEGRLNTRVLPEWMNVTDDPLIEQWEGRPVAGHYPVDLEGVRPQPVRLVENGELKTLLTTRQPCRGVPGTNGRARLPGALGVKTARISNLLVEAQRTAPLAELRKRLLEMAAQRQKPYGLLVRKMDFPSAGSLDDLRRLGQRVARGGGGRAVSLPLGIYRVYADGREELVRGLRFRGFSTRPFRDIVAASAERELFNYADNGAPLALMGAAPYVAGCSVAAPGVLFEELELEAIEEEFPHPPLVPPPGTAV